MNTKHSPLPWSRGRRSFIEDANGNGIAVCQYSTTQEADADLIVKAVNSHEELVAALKECITEEGAPGLQEGLGRMRRRLLSINEIARSVLKKGWLS